MDEVFKRSPSSSCPNVVDFCRCAMLGAVCSAARMTRRRHSSAVGVARRAQLRRGTNFKSWR